MLSRKQRIAILELSEKGRGIRPIARALKVSRKAVREVIRSESSEPPLLARSQKAEPYREQILELHPQCQGNLVRVHEELLCQGAKLSYPALTAFAAVKGSVTSRWCQPAATLSNRARRSSTKPRPTRPGSANTSARSKPRWRLLPSVQAP